MNDDYSLLAELKIWADMCQARLEYEPFLNDKQISELLIERDLALIIGYDLTIELARSTSYLY